MPDMLHDIEGRVAFLQKALADSGASGFVFGNSGGKDSALVGILCRKASENTHGVLLPCRVRRNYEEDTRDALALAQQFDIKTRTVDLTPVREAMVAALSPAAQLTEMAQANIAPRLRMTALYAISAAENLLVVGTGNRSEGHMGYFTKWGDGAFDINPMQDLTVTEIYAYLRYLNAPKAILEKEPSGALFDGQTDEAEMGISYQAIDRYLMTGEATPAELTIIERFHTRSEHKRNPPLLYKQET